MTYPLISIIIPCYNQGAYLQEALASVWRQHYPAVEIVIVDDGSTDTTSTVANQHPPITYVYQPNQGLPAARNTGIRHSRGQYLVFLDADDWLLPGALEQNMRYLRDNPQLAFVSGGHEKVYVNQGLRQKYSQEVDSCHYLRLLEKNYISMIATVMFQRWALEEFYYDTTLKASEDYDLYLRLARVFPVAHHTHCVAAYRIHSTNMSRNILLMLSSVLTVHERQRPQLRSQAEKRAYVQGHTYWKKYYSMELYVQLCTAHKLPSYQEIIILLRTNPLLVLRYFLRLLTTA